MPIMWTPQWYQDVRHFNTFIHFCFFKQKCIAHYDTEHMYLCTITEFINIYMTGTIKLYGIQTAEQTQYNGSCHVSWFCSL